MLPQHSNTFRKEQISRTDESEESLLEYPFNEDEEGAPLRSKPAFAFRIHWSYVTHGILLFICAFLVTPWMRSERQCVDLPYSPANVAIEYQKDFTTFNGSFDFPSIYRGDPSPELDAAWYRIGKGVSLTRLTREQLLKIGKEDTPSKVKFSEADGGGYMAALEVAHQLHCLNVLRKYLHFDHYGKVDPFFTESKPSTYRTHLEHCIENIRQALMCTADDGMITFEWIRGFSTPYPDFNMRHKCRNFEKIIDWQTTHDAHVPESHQVRLDGEVDLEQAP